jgi:hypothetical protein
VQPQSATTIATPNAPTRTEADCLFAYFID